MPRWTLASEVRLSGIGLFTGAPASVVMRAARAPGVTVRRTDPPHAGTLQALVAHVPPPGGGPFAKLPSRNTVLAAPPACFAATVEHILSAIVGLGLDGIEIELAGPEIPILDGSADPFVRAILDAGVRESHPDPEPITLPEPVTVEDGKGGAITATPRSEPGTRYEYRLDYGPGAPIPTHAAVWEDRGDAASHTAYARDIAPARTYCLEHEAVQLRAAGLFAHVTPRQMLVVGADGRPIENDWRYPDEPGRHKLLDLVGDLALVGRPIRADIVSSKGGHALNHALCRAVLRAAGVQNA